VPEDSHGSYDQDVAKDPDGHKEPDGPDDPNMPHNLDGPYYTDDSDGRDDPNVQHNLDRIDDLNDPTTRMGLTTRTILKAQTTRTSH